MTKPPSLPHLSETPARWLKAPALQWPVLTGCCSKTHRVSHQGCWARKLWQDVSLDKLHLGWPCLAGPRLGSWSWGFMTQRTVDQGRQGGDKCRAGASTAGLLVVGVSTLDRDGTVG